MKSQVVFSSPCVSFNSPTVRPIEDHSWWPWGDRGTRRSSTAPTAAHRWHTLALWRRRDPSTASTAMKSSSLPPAAAVKPKYWEWVDLIHVWLGEETNAFQLPSALWKTECWKKTRLKSCCCGRKAITSKIHHGQEKINTFKKRTMAWNWNKLS